MPFRSSPTIVALVAILTHCGVESKQPNILFILADDYGWNDIGYHGSEISTPTLDKLAAEGVKLENYYVQPICTPSRSQIMTGRYQIHTGLQHYVLWPGQPYGLPLTERTLADELNGLGYATHHVGKWHLGAHKWEYTPTYRGFDTSYGFLWGGQDYFTHLTRPDYNIWSPLGYDFWDMDTPLWNAFGSYTTELFATRVKELVKQHSEQHSEQPMFMYLALQSVHQPLQVPKRYMEQYGFITDEDRRTYAGMVSIMDEAVDNVTRVFKEHGLWNNTLLIFSTDNGGDSDKNAANNFPLLGDKKTMWEGGIRGVGFVSGPVLQSGGRQGTRCHEMMHVSDWFPTLVELAGGNTNGMDLDSFDMWDTISKGEPSKREEILYNIDPLVAPKGDRLHDDTFDTRIHAAIRWRDWKLLTGDIGPGRRFAPPAAWIPGVGHLPPMDVYNTSPNDPKNVWLFNIAEDPLETRDLSDREPRMVRFLLDKLAAYNQTAVPVWFEPFDPESVPAKHGGLWMPWLD